MATYRIKIYRPGQPLIADTLSAVPRVIGRSPRSDIVLPEDSISRKHARLYLMDDAVHIQDLGSCNGVMLNGSRIRDAVLTPADQIRLGSYTIRIEPVTDLTRTVTSHRTELDYEDVAPIHERLVDKDHSSLSFLYRLSQRMAPHRSLEPLLASVLDDVMELLPAGRGFVLTRDESNSAAEVCVSKSNTPQHSVMPLSQTLVAHVLNTRTSVLTSDACADERFETSDSMVAHQIQAAVCVPLTSHETVFGVIYVDSDSTPMPFSPAHLQLLSIVGQMAGAAVENVILTEKQIHQERLAAIGQTVSATSHDMRNILLGISGGTELLELAQQKQRWDRAEKATRIIRISLQRFETLVNSLLTCAQKTRLCMEDTPVGPLLREVVESLEPTADKSGVSIVVNDQSAQRISLDPHQIHRVLTNLIKNAIEAMENSGGTLLVETAEEDSGHVIRIRDTGPGIAPEHLPRMGQAFFSTKNGNGTGLGLAVCYQIMEQHRGTVRVESTLGEGATFTLVFPDSARTTLCMPKLTA